MTRRPATQSTDPAVTAKPGDRLIPQPVVRERVGNLSRTTLWRLVQKNDLPAPVTVGGRVLWSENEITNWITARLARRGL